MWEFMSKYAEIFWQAGEYVFEVFTVIMPWAITLGAAFFLFCSFATIGKMIADRIRKKGKKAT